MLSRVAERLYWIGRYMERAENTARLINVTSQSIMDLPRSANISWSGIIDIVGATKAFKETEHELSEVNISRYLISDDTSVNSIISSLKSARENARTSREIMPKEAWESLNNLYLWARDNCKDTDNRSARTVFLNTTVFSTQQYAGMLTSTMSHSQSYHLLMLGKMVERADMSTRLIDMAIEMLLAKQESDDDSLDIEPYDNLLWMHVLQSLSAYQMYRQHMARRVEGKQTVQFLLNDNFLPRSVKHCLSEISDLSGRLPRADSVQMYTRAAHSVLAELQITSNALDLSFRDFIDELQIAIHKIHNSISSTWFSINTVETQRQSQAN